MMPILKKLTYLQFVLYAFMVYWTVQGTIYFVESDECYVGKIGERTIETQSSPL